MIDLKKFKKVGDDKNSFIMEHGDGHKLKIAKNGISARTRKEFEKLPLHKAAGGEIEGKEKSPKVEKSPRGEESEEMDITRFCPVCGTKGCMCYAKGGNVDWPYCPRCGYAHPNCKCYENGYAEEHPEKFSKGGDVKNYEEGTTAGPVGDQSAVNDIPGAMPDNALEPKIQINVGAPPAQPSPQVAPPQMPVQNPLPTSSQQILNQAKTNQENLNAMPANDPFQAYLKQSAGAVNEQSIGKAEEAPLIGAVGAATEAAQHEEATNAAKANQLSQERYLALDQERKDLRDDIQNHLVDPNGYWKDHSKTASAIGLILGGMGGGLTGGGNSALQFLQNQIEQNINAQKTNLNEKNNLLSANLAQFGNMNQATEMTRVMLNDIASHKIAEAASKFAGPLARARAAQAIGILNDQNAQKIGQLSAMGSLSGAPQGQPGQGGPSAPTYIHPEMLPPEARERYVMTPDGIQRLAPTAADAGNIKDQFSSLMRMNSLLGDMYNFTKNTGRTAPQVAGVTTQAAATAKQLHGALTTELGNFQGLSRMNDNEFSTYKDMAPDPGAWQQGVAYAKINGLKKMLMEKMQQLYINRLGYRPQDVPDLTKVTSPVRPMNGR